MKKLFLINIIFFLFLGLSYGAHVSGGGGSGSGVSVYPATAPIKAYSGIEAYVNFVPPPSTQPGAIQSTTTIWAANNSNDPYHMGLSGKSSNDGTPLSFIRLDSDDVFIQEFSMVDQDFVFASSGNWSANLLTISSTGITTDNPITAPSVIVGTVTGGVFNSTESITTTGLITGGKFYASSGGGYVDIFNVDTKQDYFEVFDGTLKIKILDLANSRGFSTESSVNDFYAQIQTLTGAGIFGDGVNTLTLGDGTYGINLEGNYYQEGDMTVLGGGLFTTTEFGGATGVWATATDGVLTLQGKKTAGNNESLTFDFETSVDTVTVDTNTGVTAVNFSGLNLITTGYFQTGDVKVSGSNSGILTLGGVGNTNNENLTFDFETYADTVTISTGTGVTSLNFSGLTLTTTGSIFINKLGAWNNIPLQIGRKDTGIYTNAAGAITIITAGSDNVIFDTNYGFTCGGNEFKFNRASASKFNLQVYNSGTGGSGVRENMLSINNLETSPDNVVVHRDLVVGEGAAGRDYKVTFDGETNDGILTWMEDEDYFEFADTVKIDTFLKLNPGSAPGSPVEGDVYANSTDHHLYFYNGTGWVQLDN